MTLSPLTSQLPHLSSEETGLEMLSKVPKDTELLRNRAGTETRRAESKLLGLPLRRRLPEVKEACGSSGNSSVIMKL